MTQQLDTVIGVFKNLSAQGTWQTGANNVFCDIPNGPPVGKFWILRAAASLLIDPSGSLATVAAPFSIIGIVNVGQADPADGPGAGGAFLDFTNRGLMLGQDFEEQANTEIDGTSYFPIHSSQRVVIYNGQTVRAVFAQAPLAGYGATTTANLTIQVQELPLDPCQAA